jgi:hypothetical protein
MTTISIGYGYIMLFIANINPCRMFVKKPAVLV